jgi:hypothetical protein
MGTSAGSELIDLGSQNSSTIPAKIPKISGPK